jgi:YebC/PmpR family DNA-binding regulatory protein
MAGHSHFANIMRAKARVDARRGKEFSKVARLIMAAVRQAGPNLRDNLRLQYAVELARAANMAKDTIQRVIDRAAGAASGESFEEVTYEGYGPGGVAIFVDALTDNRHRTAPEVRAIFERNGGSIGTSGSVAWNFERKGRIEVAAGSLSEERVFEAALEAGAEDLATVGDGEERRYAVTCAASALQSVRGALAASGIEVVRGELVRVPRQTIEASEETARGVAALQTALEDLDDVQAVTTNLEVSEEIAARLAEEP